MYILCTNSGFKLSYGLALLRITDSCFLIFKYLTDVRSSDNNCTPDEVGFNSTGFESLILLCGFVGTYLLGIFYL